MEKKYDDEPYSMHGYVQSSEGHSGSQQSWIYKAVKDREEYGIKFHRHICCPNEPVKDPDTDPEGKKYERSKARYLKIVAKYEAYCDYKKKLYNAIKEAGLNGPADYWIGEGLMACDGKKTFMEADKWLDKKASCQEGEAEIYTVDLDDPTKLALLTSFAQDLYKLHAAGIVHSDIKPDNIIIMEDGGALRARAIDFDMSFFAAEPPDGSFDTGIRPYIMGGTDEYKSPEMCSFDANLSDDDYDITQLSYPIDIFAAGVSFFEFLVGYKAVIPLEGGKEEEYLRSIGKALIDGQKITLEPLYTSFSNEKYGSFWFALLGWMLDADPAARPTAEQLLDALENFSERHIPVKYKKADPYSPWEEDGIMFNEAKISAGHVEVYRGRKPGLYKVADLNTKMCFSKNVRQLLDLGYAVAAGSVLPWAGDGICFVAKGGYTVKLGDAEGTYLVRSADGEYTCDKNRLVSEGLARLDAPADGPWEDDNILFIPKEGVTICRSKVPGTYKITRGGITKAGNKTTLLSEGLAKIANPDYNRPYEGDGIIFKGKYGISVSRAEGGKYKVRTSYSSRLCTKAELIAEGLAVAVYAGNPKPWPEDYLELVSKPGFTVIRAESKGMYTVKDAAGGSNKYNAAKLVEMGLAKVNKKALPWECDNIKFVSKEGLTIARGMNESSYIVTISGISRGSTVKMLLDKGYAVKIGEETPKAPDFEFWPCDSDLELCTPISCEISRAKREPMYTLTGGGISRVVNRDQLLSRKIARIK